MAERKQMKNRLTVGLLAHVDAGKTTLSEALLYKSGAIRTLGRVDHGDAFLDTNALEKSRGITIFSKQARITAGDTEITLLDTPGHVDFSAEMERTLQVLDYAILVISGADGVQGHTRTLWKLLDHYHVPVFLFLNKMDQPGTDAETLMEQMRSQLHENCLNFSADHNDDSWQEALAMCEEELLDRYLEEGHADERAIPRLIAERKLFPCFFGSALHLEGVEELLQGFAEYTVVPDRRDVFGAKVYKISRDSQGSRLTHLKVTGGILKVKSLLAGRDENGSWEEKVDQIRIYDGDKYELMEEAPAGVVCAVTGLTRTMPGQGLGAESASEVPVLEPVLNYRILLPEDCDVHRMLGNLRKLEEEEPLLHILWNEELGEIYAQVMGEVQIEVLRSIVRERFGTDIRFDAGRIVYKETILEPVEGVGHFEPLRHYAEVHLLLEPGEPGSGLEFGTICSEDRLDRNWQRLILTHLEEKQHRGVLIGAPITDMKITLVSGRAHVKHTEGGDFRQATYRAVRQGLRSTKCRLLEPYYDFRLEIPSGQVGRAMSDMQLLCGSFSPPEIQGEEAVLTGMVPVATLADYQQTVTSYTKGRGHLFTSLKGYYPCHNEEVLAQTFYDPDADLANPTGSVFCAHGAGFVVPWDQVEEYMHLEKTFTAEKKPEEEEKISKPLTKEDWKESQRAYAATEKELEEIFERTYGPVKPRVGDADIPRRSVKGWKRSHRDPDPGSWRGYGKTSANNPESQKEYLLVDGYNMIFAWEDLKDLAQVNIDAARDKLMDMMVNYQGFRKCTLILVFDAYKVTGNPGSVETFHNIHVVYTKEAETADAYIEKTVHEIGRKYRVRVATSDRLEQVIILGAGASRVSAGEFREELDEVAAQIREEAELHRDGSGRNMLFDHLKKEDAEYLEKIRLGEEKKGEEQE